MTYQPHALGAGMALFDRLPRSIRDKLNDGVISQNADAVGAVWRLWQRSGTDAVLRVLEEAGQARLAERRY